MVEICLIFDTFKSTPEQRNMFLTLVSKYAADFNKENKDRLNMLNLEMVFATGKEYCSSGENESLSLSDRVWTCENCGTEHDRDLNAAKNIEMVGTSTIGVENVRLFSESKSC